MKLQPTWLPKPATWLILLGLALFSGCGDPNSTHLTLDELIATEVDHGFRTAEVDDGLLVKVADEIDMMIGDKDQCCMIGETISRDAGREVVNCKYIGPARCFVLTHGGS